LGSVRTFQRKALKGVRILPVIGFENYLIFYAAAGTSIQVLRILHAARDFPTIFG
jgi:plasmid stabilization system protein ParE